MTKSALGKPESPVKAIICMVIGVILMLGTALYMYFGIETHTSYLQPAFTPLGIFLGFFLMFFGMGVYPDVSPKEIIN